MKRRKKEKKWSSSFNHNESTSNQCQLSWCKKCKLKFDIFAYNSQSFRTYMCKSILNKLGHLFSKYHSQMIGVNTLIGEYITPSPFLLGLCHQHSLPHSTSTQSKIQSQVLQTVIDISNQLVCLFMYFPKLAPLLHLLLRNIALPLFFSFNPF